MQRALSATHTAVSLALLCSLTVLYCSDVLAAKTAQTMEADLRETAARAEAAEAAEAAEKESAQDSETSNPPASRAEKRARRAAERELSKAQQEAEIQAVLLPPLEEDEYVEKQRCLNSSRWREVRVLNQKLIVFEGRRGEIWLNQLHHPCPGLRRHEPVTLEPTLARRLCAMDLVGSLPRFSAGIQFARCSLGYFEQISEDQLTALQEITRQKRHKHGF